jgi:hypothetical protein
MSAAEEQVLTKEELDERAKEGGIAAFREIECTRDHGGEEVLDTEKIGKEIVPLVLAARVDSLNDRVNDAISKGDLTAKLLPDAIGPEDYLWDTVGVVGQAIWSWCVRQVWGQTNPNVSGRVQQMVRAQGLTLCRTKISLSSTPISAVYVTADLECLKQDFGLPLKTSVRNAANQLAKNIAATIETHPELARQLEKEVESGMKNATQLAKAMLALSSGEPEDE